MYAGRLALMGLDDLAWFLSSMDVTPNSSAKICEDKPTSPRPDSAGLPLLDLAAQRRSAEQFRAIVKLNSSDRLSLNCSLRLTKTDPPTPAAAPATSDPRCRQRPNARRRLKATARTRQQFPEPERGRRLLVSFVQNGKTQEFSALHCRRQSPDPQREQQPCDGRRIDFGPNQFIQPPGSVANDPGLTFEK